MAEQELLAPLDRLPELARSLIAAGLCTPAQPPSWYTPIPAEHAAAYASQLCNLQRLILADAANHRILVLDDVTYARFTDRALEIAESCDHVLPAFAALATCHYTARSG